MFVRCSRAVAGPFSLHTFKELGIALCQCDQLASDVVVVSRVITAGLERVGRQAGSEPIVNSHVPATLSDTGFSWVISKLAHPDFGTSVQPGPDSVLCDQHALSLSHP